MQCPSLHGATLHSSQTRRQRENKKEREKEGQKRITVALEVREGSESHMKNSMRDRWQAKRECLETAFVFRMCVMNTEALELELWVFGCLM